MKILNEFKKFALRGSVVDLAVGIIIGATFNGIVKSLVDDIIMPPLGYLVGEVDFQEFFITLGSEKYETLNEAQSAGAVTINYGVFINTLVSFLIVAFTVFLIVKGINSLREKEDKNPKKTSTTRPCPYCFTDISLKASRCPNCTSKVESIEKTKKNSNF